MELNTKYAPISAYELIEKTRQEPKPNYLWYGIIEGSIGLFSGVAKTGKTTFAENLAISLAIGQKKFFGYKMVGIPKKVLFINLEESYKIYSRRLDKQIKLLSKEELGLFKSNYISVPTDFPNFIETEDDWEALFEYIKRTDPDVVIIDSLTHIFSKKIEDSTACVDFVKYRLKTYLTSLNKTVIVIHHNTKGNEKPLSKDNIAGSRVLLQEFQYAIGFANIPNENGGNYCCMLYNKYIANDENIAVMYEIDKNGWFINKGTANKYNFYKNVKLDLRTNDTNKNKILRYFNNQVSQGSQIIKTSDLMSDLVNKGEMARDTLFAWIKRLLLEKKIEKINQGEYILKK